jgi:uncharacterized protein YqgC (DUF456 family)
MEMVYIIGLLVVNSVWLAGVLFLLPGNWLMVITTALFAWWQWDNGIFGAGVLIAIAAMTLAGEVFESLAGAGGAKKAGASWLGALSAIFGAVAGAVLGTILIPIPIAGTLLGVCVGAGLAVWGTERLIGRPPAHSVKTGIGAGTGVLLGITVKFAIGCIIWLTVAVAAFW